MIQIVNRNASQWLTTTPIALDHIDLSPDQLRDVLSIYYG